MISDINLQEGEVRQLVAQSERTKLSENTVVRVGIGLRSASDEYPGEAAQHTADEHPDHACCLHHESIIHGVQWASKTRIREMQEDHPWIDQAMSALYGLRVPVSFVEIEWRWLARRVVECLSTDAGPPRHVADRPDGIRRDLETLGVFQRLRDGRVNIPNVYRVGYGLGRRGGVTVPP